MMSLKLKALATVLLAMLNRLDDLDLELPDGRTRDVVNVARLKLTQARKRPT